LIAQLKLIALTKPFASQKFITPPGKLELNRIKKCVLPKKKLKRSK